MPVQASQLILIVRQVTSQPLDYIPVAPSSGTLRSRVMAASAVDRSRWLPRSHLPHRDDARAHRWSAGRLRVVLKRSLAVRCEPGVHRKSWCSPDVLRRVGNVSASGPGLSCWRHRGRFGEETGDDLGWCVGQPPGTVRRHVRVGGGVEDSLPHRPRPKPRGQFPCWGEEEVGSVFSFLPPGGGSG